MKIRIIYCMMLPMLMINSALADLYLEFGFESGGDDLIGTNTGEDISAGGGVKFAVGVQNPTNEAATASIRLSVGYLFDSIDASNGDADFETLTFDALYMINSGTHSFGIGGTLHLSPEYSDDVDGFRSEKIEFDDAYGILLQYGYNITPSIELGVKVSVLEYQAGPITMDANSFGVYISNGF